jgi:para-nitrobenzyl esterase
MTRTEDTARVDRRNLFGLAAAAATAGVLGPTLARADDPQVAHMGQAAQGAGIPKPTPVVRTRSGPVQGLVDRGVCTFKGIPYGAPPIGRLRWAPPQPARHWTATYDASDFGAPAMQMAGGASLEASNDFGFQMHQVFTTPSEMKVMNEDCLYLNVWTPAPDARRRPVMVWIHGGGYETGSSQELPAYDGERLARKGDLVFVSVNHRLGAFGFLDLSSFGGANYAMSGNAGQLDLVVALQWVRDNIAAFGGDPGNVTIFGQSGGGAKVSTLMAMPSAKGLFHKAIVESGSLLEVGDTGYTKRLAEAVLRNLDIAPGDLGKLASVPPMALVAAADKAKNSMPKPPPGKINLGWAPVADGKAIPGVTWANGAPAISAGVPMIIGTNLNEFSPSLGNAALEDADEDRAKATAKAFGGASPAAWAAFRAADPKARPVEILSRIVSAQFRVPAVAQAQTKAKQGAAPAWLYRFDYNPKSVLDGRVRAFHCAEMAYAFDNVDRCLNATGGTVEARALSARMSAAWIAFARTGNPNHKGLPHWPAVSTGAVPNMLFDAVCTVKDDPDRAQLAALTV